MQISRPCSQVISLGGCLGSGQVILLHEHIGMKGVVCDFGSAREKVKVIFGDFLGFQNHGKNLA